MNTVHQIAVIARYMPATNCRASRIKLSLPRWENKSITFSYYLYETQLSKTEELAELHLRNNNITPIAVLDMGGFYILVIDFAQREKLFDLFGLDHTFELEFTGRTVGAIGIFQPYKILIRAKSEKEVIQKLYAVYEHISMLKITKI